MNLVRKFIIEELHQVNDSSGTVSQIKFKYQVSDDSDNVLLALMRVLSLDTSNPNGENFISYQDLTPEIIESWLKEQYPNLENQLLEESNGKLSNLLNPQQPLIISSDLPW